jgi:CubicO group peptidase (beta-lactamase class C family)
MGILMLAEIVERVTTMPLRDFLKSNLFEPLRMNSTSLGWSNDLAGRVIEATPSPESDGSWVWNSPYWRNLGAPWGGAFSTAGDIARFLEVFLDGGTSDGTRILQSITAQGMISDQTVGIPGADRNGGRKNGWGLGWQIQRRGGGGGFFGSLTPPGAFGHSGSTGTLAWADPQSESVFVMLTSGKMPQTHRTLKRCSNVIAAAMSGSRTS